MYHITICTHPQQRISKRLLFRILLIVCLLLALGWAIWYHLPITVSTTTLAYTPDGESMEVTLHMQLFRYFFKPTEASGYIEMDGKTFVDLSTKGIATQNESLIHEIKEKYSGTSTCTFVDSSLDRIHCGEHRIDITIEESNMTISHFVYINYDEATMFSVLIP